VLELRVVHYPCTNNHFQTAWGSREGADTDDKYRMIRLPPYDSDEKEEVEWDASAYRRQRDENEQLLPPYSPLMNRIDSLR